MSEGSPADGTESEPADDGAGPEPADDGAGPEPADDGAEPEPADDEGVPLAGLSDEGVLLVFAGLACLLAAVTAVNRGQPEPVVVFGAAAGAVGLVVVAVDLLSEYAPGLWAHLAVGGGALLAAGFAAPGRHYVNVATFGAAAALVLWRVVDIEYRGAA